MNSFKNILKENIEILINTLIKSIIFLFVLVITGIMIGFIAFLPIEHKKNINNEGFIHGCMAAGLSESACKKKVQ